MKIYLLNEFIINNLNKDILTFDQLKKYIIEIIKELELENYLNDVIESDEVDFASYNIQDNTIKINYNDIIKYAKVDHRFLDSSINFYLFVNSELLINIFHEIVHIIQTCLYTEYSNEIYQIYKQNFELITAMTDKEYVKTYDCLTVERDANITAFENLLSILESYYSNETELIKYYYTCMKKQLLTGYIYSKGRLISPIENIYKNYMKQEAPIIDNISTYNKLKIGADISKSTYYDNKKKADELIKKELKRNY